MGQRLEITRRTGRLQLSVPARIKYAGADGTEQSEMSRIIDVSALGASFHLPFSIPRGRLIHLTIPLARQLRLFDFSEPQYKIWALVRYCTPVKKDNQQQFFIGTAFTGKTPPESYLSNPLTIYDTADQKDGSLCRVKDSTANTDTMQSAEIERQYSRHIVPVEIVLEILDANGKTLYKEQTVTENISKGGAAVFTAKDIQTGTRLCVTSGQFNVSMKSIVRGRHLGADGITRLHLEFSDGEFPLEGFE